MLVDFGRMMLGPVRLALNLADLMLRLADKMTSPVGAISELAQMTYGVVSKKVAVKRAHKKLVQQTRQARLWRVARVVMKNGSLYLPCGLSILLCAGFQRGRLEASERHVQCL